jgi:hypothetical protein
MQRDLVIAIGALPPRPRRLSEREISDIFGGCVGKGWKCDDDCDCCLAPSYNNENYTAYCESGVCKERKGW